jgi:hypothetical protein
VRDLNADFVFSVERQGMRVLNISETLPTKLANNIHAVVSAIIYITYSDANMLLDCAE